MHHLSVSFIPEQNGLAERKNRIFLEMINAMILSAELQFNLWSESLLSTCHIVNRIPLKKNKVSPL